MEEYPTPVLYVVVSAPFAIWASGWGQVFYLLMWGLFALAHIRQAARR